MSCCKPCAFVGQSLITHTESVVKYVEKLIDNGYHETVTQRLRRLKPEVTREKVAEYMIIAAAFHDVGKSIELYQKKFGPECEPYDPQDTGFPLHEVFSSVYLTRVFSKHGLDDLALLTILAVLNHLHAMRDYPLLRDILSPDLTYSRDKGFIKSLEKSDELFITEYNLNRLVEYLSKRCGLDRDLLTTSLSGRVDLDELRRVINIIGGAERDSYKRQLMKGYVFFLLPVIIGDNLDAYYSRRHARGEEVHHRRFFIDELAYAVGGVI